MLLRKLDKNGCQEHLEICVFQVDPAGKTLQWFSNNNDDDSDQVAIGSIADVSEERPGRGEELGEEGGMIQVTFTGASRRDPMQMIFASAEDVVTWRDGLRFLVDVARAEQRSGSPKAKASPGKAVASQGGSRQVSRVDAAAAGAPASKVSAGVGQLLERIQLQEELIKELREENSVLTDIAKQKDDLVRQKDLEIANLMKELKNRGSKSENFNKTESTSRESDDHLRDREMAVLRSDNKRLKKQLHKKQVTITNLMQTLQSALKGEASDADMVRNQDDEEADSDSPVALAAAVRALPCSTDSGSEPEAIREEVRALASKRESPQAASQGRFAPPGRAMPKSAQGGRQGASAQASAKGSSLSPAAQRETLAAQARAQAMAAAVAGLGGSPGFDFSAVGGDPRMARGGSMSKESKSALEALARQTELLEERKRAVEQLARHLEPPSDNEDEDDGFPLQ